jgi:hypothetical protein
MTRTALVMVTVGVRVRHTFFMRRDFPMFVGVGGLGQSEHGPTAEPGNPEMALTKHGGNLVLGLPQSQAAPRLQ